MEPIEPPEWLRSMFQASDDRWRPTIYYSDHTTRLDQPIEALPDPPPFADYEEHTCPVCRKHETSFEMCGSCQIAYLEPTYGWLRQAVHDGSRSDFGDAYCHHDMQVMWEAAPDKWHNWRLVFQSIIVNALSHGFNTMLHDSRSLWFWPEYFNEKEEDAA